MYETLSANARQAAESRLRAARPVSSSSSAVRRPASASSAVFSPHYSSADPLAPRTRQRPASALGVHRDSVNKINKTSGFDGGHKDSGGFDGNGVRGREEHLSLRRRPSSALGVSSSHHHWHASSSALGPVLEGGGVFLRDDLQLSREGGGRLRPASAHA